MNAKMTIFEKCMISSIKDYGCFQFKKAIFTQVGQTTSNLLSFMWTCDNTLLAKPCFQYAQRINPTELMSLP